MSDTGFSIDQETETLTCSKCESEHSLAKEGEGYDHCKCYNIRLIRCKHEIHITLFKEKKDLWYEYTRIRIRMT